MGFLWGGGGVRVLIVVGGGGRVGERETARKKSPGFRSPEVGTSAIAPTKKENKKKKLVLICTLFLP